MNKFFNKKVFITGAGAGIGYGIAKKMAKEGAIVGLNDINVIVAQKAADKINAELSRSVVFPYAFDVSDINELKANIREFTNEHKGLDIVVANAGITNYGSFLEYSLNDLERLLAVNIKGSFFTAQAAAKAMLENKVPGRILFMSSVTGVQAHLNLSAYGATKAAINMLVKSLALELGAFNITVNAIGAGATLTERTIKDDPNYEDNWNQVSANKNTATVEDIVAAVLFLASPEAKHITGTTLMVDGGWTIQSPLPGNYLQK
ncbi:MAG: SDR family oxidoreductase [Bacteroidota bacterium]|nr:SDR family oxidoreductase [Bacteroidota bacterium]